MNEHIFNDPVVDMCRKCGITAQDYVERNRPPCPLSDAQAPYEHVALTRAKSEMNCLVVRPVLDLMRQAGGGV